MFHKKNAVIIRNTYYLECPWLLKGLTDILEYCLLLDDTFHLLVLKRLTFPIWINASLYACRDLMVNLVNKSYLDIIVFVLFLPTTAPKPSEDCVSSPNQKYVPETTVS